MSWNDKKVEEARWAGPASRDQGVRGPGNGALANLSVSSGSRCSSGERRPSLCCISGQHSGASTRQGGKQLRGADAVSITKRGPGRPPEPCTSPALSVEEELPSDLKSLRSSTKRMCSHPSSDRVRAGFAAGGGASAASGRAQHARASLAAQRGQGPAIGASSCAGDGGSVPCQL